MEENKFDIAAKTWDDDPEKLLMASKFSQQIVRLTEEKTYESAMEYGCGTGNVSFGLKGHFNKIILTDSSTKMLEIVKDKIKIGEIRHFETINLDLNIQDTSIQADVIFTLMTMHHIMDTNRIMEKFSSIINPNGMLIIGDLIEESGDFHPYPDNKNVHFGFRKEYLDNIALKNNFQPVYYDIFHTMQRTHTGNFLSYPIFISAYLAK